MFKAVQKLIPPDELKALYPADSQIKNRRDSTIKDILLGRDKRLLLIAGPCSLDGAEGINCYLKGISALSERVSDKFFFVPRLYTAKPRSSGGFMGLLHSPDIAGEDMAGGIVLCRKILTGIQNDFGVTGADELLYPQVWDYFDDLVSYVTVGARSSLNQEHRIFVSGLDIAAGIKNPLNGSLQLLAASVCVARTSGRLIKNGFEFSTSGNPLAHAVLRGYTDNEGNRFGNAGIDNVIRLNEELSRYALKDVPVIIDASHDNSSKNHRRQSDVIRQIKTNLSNDEYRRSVRGIMLESYVFEGSGRGRCQSGLSLTDACMSLKQTDDAVMELYRSL